VDISPLRYDGSDKFTDLLQTVGHNMNLMTYAPTSNLREHEDRELPKENSLPGAKPRQGEDEAQKLHLRNTTHASNPTSGMSESRTHESGSKKVLRVGPMANHVIVPNQFFGKDVPKLSGLPQMHQSMLTSLFLNLKEAIFPEKLPPLRLTSRPVNVGEIWSNTRAKKATSGSLTLHAFAIAGLIAVSLWGGHSATVVKPEEHVTLIAPPLTDYQPVMKPVEAPKALAGGGGGGNASKIFESKGHLPKVAPEQFTPPTVEILNNKPKLAMEATVVAPANVKLPDNPNMPNLGNPMSARVSGPASNGTGTGGGIGSGTNNGIGSGAGPGHGPGQGGGFGGGTYKIGDIGVSPPVAKFTPEPDFTEEARKAKYQGTVVLAAVVGPDGRPRNIRVVRGLGMGLDEKAVERVKTWLFEPGKRNGTPVAVAMNFEVDFRLF
jgi:TonB family protein